MNDLRKAAEMALETLEEINKLSIGEKAICLPAEIDDAMEVLRQALAQSEEKMRIEGNGKLTTKPYPDGYDSEQQFRQALNDKPPVKSYCGGKPNYCVPLQSDRIRIDPVTGDVSIGTVDAVNMSQDRVDETAKGEHEPVAWADKVGAVIPHSHKLFQPDLLKDYTRPLYTAPPKREWVGLTDEEIEDAMDYWSDDEHSDFGGAYQADGEYFNVRASWRYIEAKLKEKNT